MATSHGWSVSALVVATAFLLLAFAPAAPAAPTPDKSVLDLYLTATALAPGAPTAAASASRSIVTTASVPSGGVGVLTAQITEWGRYAFPVDTVFQSNAVLTVWITADTAAVLNDFRAYIYKNAETAQLTSGGRLYADSTNTSPDTNNNVLANGKKMRVELGLNLANIAFKAKDEIVVKFWASAATAAGTPTDIKVLYGSTEHPSRLSGSVSNLGGVSSTTVLKSYFFGDKTLTRDAPTAEAPLKRRTESGGPVSGANAASVALATTWSWAKITLTEPLEPSGDAMLTCWVTLDGDAKAAAMRGLRALVVMTPPGKPAITRQQDIGIVQRAYQSATPPAATHTSVLGINMAGVALPAGSTVELQFITWSTSEAAGDIVFLFGGKNHPAALQFIAPGIPGAATPSESPSATTAASNTTTTPSTSASASPSNSSQSASGTTGAADGADGKPADAKDAGSASALPGAGLWMAAIASAVGLALLRRRR